MRTIAAWCAGLAAGLVLLPAAFGAGDVEAGAQKAQACVACHGPDGNSVDPQYPRIAGQVSGYIARQLADYKSGARANALMSGIVQPLSEQDMLDLDAFYASQAPASGFIAEDQVELAQEGERLYRGGDPERGTPACMACHGPTGAGIPPLYPRVAGQHAGYSAEQLWAFKNGERMNDDEVMQRVAFLLSARQIEALSVYMQGIQPRQAGN
jgi:cytochrome c553